MLHPEDRRSEYKRARQTRVEWAMQVDRASFDAYIKNLAPSYENAAAILSNPRGGFLTTSSADAVTVRLTAS